MHFKKIMLLAGLLAIFTAGCELVHSTRGTSSPDAGDVGQDDVGSNPFDTNTFDPDSGTPSPTQLSAEEHRLFEAINEYRAEHGLAAVPISPSLTIVAQTHAQDLVDHHATVLAGDCNLHSWSDQGPWSGCCYTSDHAQARCMWDKPSELTNYQGMGYEISTSGPTTASAILSLWKSSPGHNDVILNNGIWAARTWRAMGVGIAGNYAHVWFGAEVDPSSL